MSLTKINMVETVKKQYLFKLKANIDSFSSLVWIQLLAILFSFNGIGSSGMGMDNMNINVNYYSSDMVIIFSLIWSLVTAITIVTKPYRNQDFSFITNRSSSSLSNILFLITANLLGTLTAILSGNLLKLLINLFFDQSFYGISANISSYVLGFSMTFFYLMLVSSIGYLIGTLTQISKIFVIVIPAILFGGSIMEAGFLGREPLFVKVFQQYVFEPSLLLFLIKSILTTAILFFISIQILNRLEVRR